MIPPSTWIRYLAQRLDYAVAVSRKGYERGIISETQLVDAAFKTFLLGKLTYMHWNKGKEMVPTLGGQGRTLLVRKLPAVDPSHIFVGDVVVLRDPKNPQSFIVRRLAAIGGYEMVSADEKDEPFTLEKDECWVVADNEKLKPKEAHDSRIFGPVSMTDIHGRVIYSLQTAVDHGPVQNSRHSMQKDSPVLQVELDVDEMAKKSQSLKLCQHKSLTQFPHCFLGVNHMMIWDGWWAIFGRPLLSSTLLS